MKIVHLSNFLHTCNIYIYISLSHEKLAIEMHPQEDGSVRARRQRTNSLPYSTDKGTQVAPAVLFDHAAHNRRGLPGSYPERRTGGIIPF